jgi:hypothetical protein
MKCTNVVSDDGQYIISTITGDFTAKEILAAALEAHKLAAERGITRQLVDATGARNVDSAFGNYDFAYADFPAAVAINKRLSVAILVRPGDRSHDFPETAMRNAGFNVALFRERDRAIAFLCSSRPGGSAD